MVVQIENNTWARGGMELLFECPTRYPTSERSERARYRVKHKKGNSICPSNHVLFCLLKNSLLTRRSRLHRRFTKRTRCHSWRQIERVTCQQLIGDLKHVKNYRNFSHVKIRFFSVVEIPIKHSSLYKKRN